ncbi:HAMP domain-containing sensor histidine kinase [Rhizorhabdus wittichii]|uniref:histidine kinase n=1 Tax=Rhizorhabdus wittichii TaxID=160791 RepID=A0A975CZ30_9SPHN|nr:HAMP domain-containing sensor histidine kinase [Rhizorhabdus wittichii]QTH20315.1 HAMP domain-containing histidine kinase [Rhizorhabdus wittichii]
MKRLRSLRALTAAFLVAFITATGLTGLAVYRATHGTIVALVDQRIASVSGELAAMGTHSGTPELVRQIDALARERDTGDLGLLLTTANGRFLAGNIRLRRALPEGFSTVGRALGLKGLSTGRALVRPIGDGLILTVVAETEPFDDYNAARARIYLFGFGSIILVVVAGVATFGFVIGRRIVAMRRTVEAIVDGDMQRRVPVDGSDSAFDQQARAFNAMLDRIAALMAEISNVSNDIAHDLRTPLARLRGRLQALARRAEDGAPPGAIAAEIEAAIAESDTLLAMFAAILRIAEIEGGARRAGFERVDLGAIAHHVATTMQPAAADAGRSLADGDPVHLPVAGDRRLLAQALINLVENAIRHTPEGSRIRIAATRTGDRAVVAIEDDGPGIPAAERARALRRFGRLDGSRASSGHGLGLPLVESIARLHRGTLSLDDAGPGLRAVIALPIAS